MIFAIIVLCVFNTALTFLCLAASGRAVIEGRNRYEEFHGAVRLGVRAYSDLDSKLDNALSCLVSKDAALDAIQNPQEMGANAG